MQTLEKVTNEWQSQIVQITTAVKNEEKDSIVNRMKRRRDFLRVCVHYLESNPSEDFIKKEETRLENRINMYMKEYQPLDETKSSKKECTAHRVEYQKEMGIPKLRIQLKTLYYLLKD